MWGKTRPPATRRNLAAATLSTTWGRFTANSDRLAGLDGRAPLERLRLRRAALRYATHGWPVTPGACLTRHQRFVCGRISCSISGCHPALEDWERHTSVEPTRVAAWWRLRPHAVLLATGRAFDVLEVPAYLGRHALNSAHTGTGPHPPGEPVHGPVAVTPDGRWMFLVRPGDPLRPELDACLYIVRHGPGSWIPAPPTRLVEGTVRWEVAPEETNWHLPDSYAVQNLLVEAVREVTPVAPGPFARFRVPVPRRGR
jgi:hypothetical protein